ncbi:MFS transporter [Tenacibaculum sp.]|uniref:MFS transporter n=1 Tax=Tenacibaculum sp. TaxID=1906242 RepID=UPI003D124269
MLDKNSKTVFSILYFISFSHLINDLIQGVIPSVYPILKQKYGLTFVQIGLITFAFQFSASILQPIIGYYTDKKPKVYSQIYGLFVSMLGILLLSYASDFNVILLACVLIGVGSAIFHPESSRIANLASGGKVSIAQSIFQIGGNLGTALAPLLVAIIVLPDSQELIITFVLPLILSFLALIKVAIWYKRHITKAKFKKEGTPKHKVSFTKQKIQFILSVLLVIIFSKFIYAASLSNYYSFYLIEKFGLTVGQAQIHLFIYLFSYMLGTILGGVLGDKFGRRNMIWFSVLGATPFTLLLPYVNLFYTDVFMVIIGIIMASAFPTMLSYAQELLPNKLGVISGVFFGFAFGVAALGAAVIGLYADYSSIYFVYQLCSFFPLIGGVCLFLPELNFKPHRMIANHS